MTDKQVFLYDTTLRDGTQREGLSLSLEDKLKIARYLDDFGVHYVEGGWPGANPKDVEFFARLKSEPLKSAKLVAFGSTRRKGTVAADDPGIKLLLDAQTPALALVGKSWDLHVDVVLKATRDENLAMISDSIALVRAEGREVILDAEHFFDGFKSDSSYALETLIAAAESGASWLALCDTNGGSLPSDVVRTVSAVRARLDELGHGRVGLSIHAHNDSDCAVANSLAAVEAGCRQVQGTVNGYGERCGNANLISIIPAMQFKMGMSVVSSESLARLTELSHYVSEVANVIPATHQPYIGDSAFTHKGGLHVDGISKHSDTFEHIDPALVGNSRHIAVSELSGRSTIELRAKEALIPQATDREWAAGVLSKVKEMEHRGYHFEAADASFELLLRREAGLYAPSFELESFRVIMEQKGGGVVQYDSTGAHQHREPGIPLHSGEVETEATVKLWVGGKRAVSTAEGNGPVNALDRALRLALARSYPVLQRISLSDYKVRVLDERSGTGAIVRVLLESTDGERSWGTIGVSENIIEASWQALVDGFEFGLLHARATFA